MADVPENPHFATAASWEDAAAWVEFTPARPAYAGEATLAALRVFIRDHRMPDVPRQDRTLEAHYGAFVFSQQLKASADAARDQVLTTSYGSDPAQVSIAGRMARIYELGAEPGPDDPDGRMPAVVVWHEGPMFYLLASGEYPASELLLIAELVEGGSPS